MSPPTILSVCHPGNRGLLDHSAALVSYGQQYDANRSYLAVHGVRESLRAAARTRRHRRACLWVLWDNSLLTLLIGVGARVLGGHVVYMLHEPGGVGQKLTKGDPFVYSCLAALAETAMTAVSHSVVVPRRDRLAFGDAFVPLLYDEARPEPHTARTRRIGFLGARRAHRLAHLFTRLVPRLRETGIEVSYFPSKDRGTTYSEKIRFLQEMDLVWNVYGVPFNQSGVTGDCIMSMVPMVCSVHEPERALLGLLGLKCEIDLRQTEEEIGAVLIAFLADRQEEPSSLDMREARALRSMYGGSMAFQTYWKPLFDRIFAATT